METLRDNLIYVLNHSGVTLEAAYYVTKDVFRELEDQYRNYLAEQIRQKALAEREAQQETKEENAAEE